MFHQTHPIEPVADWRDTLRHGDVVAFQFPVADGDRAAPKSRPCLVTDAVSIAGSRLVTLAYSTTAYTNANRGYEIHATRPEAMHAAGLKRPTRFVAARRITVAVDHAGFVANTPGSPVLGRLGEAESERLNEVRARLHAEADITAERRHPRRRVRPRRPGAAA